MELFSTLEIGWLNGWILLVFIILTTLKIQTWYFVPGLVLYVIGMVGLVVAMFNFRDTALNQPVTKGVYKISRHP